MMRIGLYLGLLLLILFLCLYALINNIKNAPFKIKIFNMLIILAFMLRYICLLVLFNIKNLNNLYLIKPMLFTNLFFIPLLVLSCFYVFLRKDELKFDYNFLALAIISLLYGFINYRFPIEIRLKDNVLYVGNLAQGNIVYITFSILILLFAILCFLIGHKKKSNLKGLRLIGIFSIIFILEYILSNFGIEIFPEKIIGEFLYIILLNYSLLSFKK